MAQAPLPVQFDKDRDSRHNYKSRELSAVYKNRETTRDAFLSMLRDFKTSGFTNHAVTVDSSHLITQLTEYGNLDWFSDFFVLTVTHMGEGEGENPWMNWELGPSIALPSLPFHTYTVLASLP